MILMNVPVESYQRWLSFWGHPANIDSDTQKQLIEAHLRKVALTVPLIEAGFGLGLLFPQTRPLATLMAVGMHCFILFWLTKVGHEKSPTIGPWNFVMMLTTVALFWSCDSPQSWDILIGDHCLTHMLVLLLFTLMPTLGLFNRLRSDVEPRTLVRQTRIWVSRH